MSASLVGSEMCIRDSLHLCSPHASSSCPDTVPSPTGLFLLALNTPVPVSYTHLTLPTICSV
eukprot:10642717-Alexandrium_andersonii.AAC.1